MASLIKSTKKIQEGNSHISRGRIGLNSKMLNIEIRKYISSKLEIDKSKEFEISTDIYTTS